MAARNLDEHNTPSGAGDTAGIGPRRSDPPRRWTLVRSAIPVLVAVVCLVAVFGLAQGLARFSAVGSWFFWRLVTLWLWELVFVAGCLGLGALICKRALRHGPALPALERLVLASAVGAVAFAMLLYAAGALRLLRPTFAVAMPLGAAVAAMVWARPQLREALSTFRDARWTLSPSRFVVVSFGVLCIALIYVHVLTPEALNHDAHWTHVVIAQDYARAGRLVPIYAGWTRNYPHLASMFYSWCYLVPGLTDQERLLLIMHTEFVFFLGTLVGVVAATRWFTYDEGRGCRTAWVAFFLFPSIFVYDSNLGGSADHVAAFFMLPLFLTFMRATESFSPGLCVMAGALAGAALITKYQSSYVTASLGLVAAVRLARVAVRHLRKTHGDSGPSLRRALTGSAALAGAALITASPYFIVNLVFYRNPVFPFMQDVFKGSTPTLPDAAWLMSNVATPIHARAVTQWGPRLINGLSTLFTFSFSPHYAFTNGVPYFGFLFTILAPLSLLLPRAHRVHLGALVGAGAVLAWGMTYLVDRNLQIVLPILVAVTAAVIARIWHLGWVARIGLVPLLLFQVVWGADFISEGALQPTIAHIREGAAGRVNVRETIHRRAMTRALPPNATVLLHSDHPSLGLDRTVVADLSESQGLLDYHRFRTPREAYDRFRAVGITHLAWLDVNSNVPVRQAEIIFLALVKPLPASWFGPYKLAELPRDPPPETAPYRVLALGVPGVPDGVYPIEELSKCEMRPPEVCTAPRAEVQLAAAIPPQVISSVDVVLTDPNRTLDPAAEGVLRSRFQLVKSTPQYAFYLVR